MAGGLEEPRARWRASLQSNRRDLHGLLPRAGQQGKLGAPGPGGLVGVQRECGLNDKAGILYTHGNNDSVCFRLRFHHHCVCVK